MKKFITSAMAGIVLAASAAFTFAGDPPGMPHRGQSMDQVRSQYGEPVMTLDAVGTPPITRWEYQGYWVYFEHNLVITSVAD